MISIVSTYRNRRHHIEETLPTWLSIKTKHDYEIVIVDYNTDDDVGEFFRCAKSHTMIRHVCCKNLSYFNLSHARNIGANYVNNDLIMFVDIDTCLSKDCIDVILGLMDKDNQYLAAVDSQVRKEIVNGGLIAVGLNHHKNIYGFNENIEGWGFEDIDYKRRLERMSLRYCKIPENIYTCIDHEDIERTQCYEDEKEISWTKNRQIALKNWDNKNHGQWNPIIITDYKR